MLLKCETTLNVYQHKDKTILCRVKAMPTNDKHSKNGGHRNTCRSLTTDQWNAFDKELSSWLDLDENNDSELDEQLCQFVIKPSFEVKIRKSTVSVEHFYKCVRNCSSSDDLDVENVLHILDCSLEYKPISAEYKPTIGKLPPTPSIPTDEYEPIPTTGIKNESTSPLTYEPYTPSKRTQQFSNADKIKTPGFDLGGDSAEDTYSPKPNGGTSTKDIQAAIPVYKPAPISEKRISKDSDDSTPNEVIVETEDELSTVDVIRSQRSRDRIIRRHKTRDHGEYIPESQDIPEDVPAYNPTPIDDSKSQQETKVPKEMDRKHEIEQVSQQQKEINKTETFEEGKKHKVKRDKLSRDIKTTDAPVKEPKRSSYTPSSSEDEFEKASSRNKDKVRKKKEKRKSKESESEKEKEKESKTDEKRKSREHSNEKEAKTDEKRKSKESSSEKGTKTYEKQKSKESASEKGAKKDEKLSSSIRRSERSPSKPRRFIEEQFEAQKRQKSLKSSPSNKELFGTDDDEIDDRKRSDSNNNANNRIPSIFHTPKPDKKNTSLLLTSSSSSSKKKRKRNDCEQEKTNMNKWLGKKDTNSKHGLTSDSKISTSTTNEKSSKKQKSSKEEKTVGSKPGSPQPMDIVMPSEKEMELMRKKRQLQREDNEKFKAALAEIIVPPPKEVNELSLRHMTLDELLDTFKIYKNDLDEIYEKNCKKDHVKSHEGINHCLVIGLIDQGKQLKMLEKLSDIYNNTKSTTQATLYANALLPEWIIRVFMEKHNLKRLEAIKQIEDQDAYKSYIDGQNENSFLDDL